MVDIHEIPKNKEVTGAQNSVSYNLIQSMGHMASYICPIQSRIIISYRTEVSSVARYGMVQSTE